MESWGVQGYVDTGQLITKEGVSMKTAEEKANLFMASLPLGCMFHEKSIKFQVLLLLKEQDRDTRHACAEAVLQCREVCETPTGGSAISPDDAHAACMNVNAV